VDDTPPRPTAGCHGRPQPQPQPQPQRRDGDDHCRPRARPQRRTTRRGRSRTAPTPATAPAATTIHPAANGSTAIHRAAGAPKRSTRLQHAAGDPHRGRRDLCARPSARRTCRQFAVAELARPAIPMLARDRRGGARSGLLVWSEGRWAAGLLGPFSSGGLAPALARGARSSRRGHDAETPRRRWPAGRLSRISGWRAATGAA